MAKARRTLALCAILALALGGGATAAAASPKAAVQAWRIAHEMAIVTDFSTLLAMPNVATTVADVEKNAAYIRGLLEARGFKTQLLYAEPGTPPSVFAEFDTPGAARTVLYYAHYDGQPMGRRAGSRRRSPRRCGRPCPRQSP